MIQCDFNDKCLRNELFGSKEHILWWELLFFRSNIFRDLDVSGIFFKSNLIRTFLYIIRYAFFIVRMKVLRFEIAWFKRYFNLNFIKFTIWKTKRGSKFTILSIWKENINTTVLLCMYVVPSFSYAKDLQKVKLNY